MRYFISYVWKRGNGDYGFGSEDVIVARPFRDGKDIKEVIATLAKSTRSDEIVILYWCKFEEGN